MWLHYLKTAWKNLQRDRVFSFINIFGLTIGLAACMLVATVVLDDLSYDRQWKNSNQLYRIVTVNKMGDGLYDKFTSSFTGLSTKLRTDYPEVKAVSELFNYDDDRFKFSNSDPNGIKISIMAADTSIWRMLDLKILAGNPRNYVAGTGNIVITESFENEYFPKENAVGKIIYSVPTFSQKSNPYLITGVIKDIPSNSVFRTQAIIIKKPRNEELVKEQYGTFTPNNYILVKPGTDIAKFTEKVNKWYASFVTTKTPYQFEFQPLKNVYLHSDFAENQQVKGDVQNIYIFSGVALLLLIIACVNYVNLSTAKAVKRLKETGVRKILGAERRHVVQMFLTESVMYFSIGSVLATGIYWWTLPLTEKFLGHHLEVTLISRFYLFVIAYAVILLFSLLIGFYPAWIMSGFKPTTALKGKSFSGKFSIQTLVRKSLVVLQFSISILVIIALIVVWQQVSFMKHKDIGFNKNNLLNIGFVSWDNKGQSFKNELLNLQGVESASITSWTIPSAGYMTREIDDPNHAGNKLTVWYIDGDIDLVKTLGLHLKSGRLFDASYADDKMSQDSLMNLDSAKYVAAESAQSSVLTSYTAKLLQVKNLNTPIKHALTTPVGIVEDFNGESLRKPLLPTIILADKSLNYGGMLIRVKHGYENQVMTGINKLWRKFYPEKFLDMKWIDDMLNNQYKAESRLQQIFSFFSVLSMLLATLGIFGLVMQSLVQRTKEIGIRKVLGASVQSIARLFSIEYLKLLILAVVIASPVGWLLMHKWLQDYAYRINIEWWVFAVAGIVAVIVAIGTVRIQTIKAARANPVKSLKTE
ncbi:hypothetical protein A9P82_09110 [Arachidicoccus ginsenosidimutans]|uniref:ABC transporter permease n=1 Tax=Arachidicoccus sp. BS20 TaxID=1850526 RepID=UPI0007F0A5B0|nr:ABC transporter permease [Arachidicoccus sp. BS20]ANI89440.1 hypothetical protein A9P82_09110 [Arachidicoccus sp. BS20]